MNYIKTTQTYLEQTLLTQKQKQQILTTLTHQKNEYLSQDLILTLTITTIDNLISDTLNEEYNLFNEKQKLIEYERLLKTDRYVDIYKINKKENKNQKQYKQLITLQNYLKEIRGY